MNRLTESKMEKEVRIGFAMIDRHFYDAISKLDDLKKEYERKLIPSYQKYLDLIMSAEDILRQKHPFLDDSFIINMQQFQSLGRHMGLYDKQHPRPAFFGGNGEAVNFFSPLSKRVIIAP